MKGDIAFPPNVFREFERQSEQRVERAALIVTDRRASTAKREIRQEMAGAGLGRLGNAVDASSDLKKSGEVHRTGGGFSASGFVFVRSKSERTLGTLQAYTEGADIVPVRGRFLWIATDEIPARAGRRRMTPALYRSSGLEQSIGKLEPIPGRHGGEALLIVRNVTTARSGRRGSALSRKRRVAPSREERDFIVAFVGIRGTSRAARANPTAIVAANQARVAADIAAELARD